MCLRSSDEEWLSLGRLPQAEDGRVGERPREMRIAEVCPGGSRACSGRGLGTLDETTIGSALLDPWDAVDVVACGHQPETEARADAGPRTSQLQRVGVMVPGRFEEREFYVAKQMIVGGDAREVNFPARVHRGIGKTFGAAVTVGFGGAGVTDGRQVILAVGLLHVRQQLTPFVRQRHATAEPIAGGPHGGGRDSGLGQQTTAAQDGNVLGVNRVVCGLTAIASLHGEGMAEDARDTFGGAPIGEPGPR